jgi:hypothetical protein
MTTAMFTTAQYMQWQDRWLPKHLLDDAEDLCEVKIDEDNAGEIVTIGTEPIITPSSFMTFEQIVAGVRLCNAIKLHFIEKEKPAPAPAQIHFRRGVRTRSHREIGRLTSRYGRTKKTNRRHY